MTNVPVPACEVECQKLLADRGRQTTSVQELRQKAQVLTVLTGERAAADQLLRDAPQMFPTIEDFMWFRIAIIRTPETSNRTASTIGNATYKLSGERFQGSAHRLVLIL